MSILPVLDLMGGQVVRGIAGRRENYRPIVSKLVDSADPIAIARAFRKQFGFRELYLADLDAIRGEAPATDLFNQLQDEHFEVWIDAGVSSMHSLGELRETCANLIVGLETIGGPSALRSVIDEMGPDAVIFSLDLKGGRPLGNVADWGTADPWTIAEKVIDLGAVRLIVLDLANVGVNSGVGTHELCTRLREEHPHLELTTGGGVRTIDDVRRLESIGVDHVLVASALHDGRITPPDVA